jgi:hypothetical protein
MQLYNPFMKLSFRHAAERVQHAVLPRVTSVLERPRALMKRATQYMFHFLLLFIHAVFPRYFTEWCHICSRVKKAETVPKTDAATQPDEQVDDIDEDRMFGQMKMEDVLTSYGVR